MTDVIGRDKNIRPGDVPRFPCARVENDSGLQECYDRTEKCGKRSRKSRRNKAKWSKRKKTRIKQINLCKYVKSGTEK